MFVITAKISFLSVPNVHPDEKYHVLCATYYKNHTLPPKYDDEAIIHTYSEEGFSRLNYLDFSHFLAGKATFLSFNIHLKNPNWKFNIANLLLLIIILSRFLYLLFTNNQKYFLYLFFLLFPQIWYIFSYVNDDALPLFITFLLFEVYFYFKNTPKYYIILGLVIGTLFLSKSHFYIPILFIGIILFKHFISNKNSKMMLIPLTALVLISIRYTINMYINSTFFLYSKLYEMMNKTIKIDTFNHLENNLHHQGFPIQKLITEMHWIQTTAYSFIGVFGKMNIFLPQLFYRSCITLLILLVFYILYKIFYSKNYFIILNTIITMLILIITSFLFSYFFDFQPQGRYLFPIIPAIGYCVYYYRASLKSNIITFLYSCLLILSLGGYGYAILFLGL